LEANLTVKTGRPEEGVLPRVFAVELVV